MKNQVGQTIDLDYIITNDGENYIYRIPEYQREYVWGKEQVNYLINDFVDFNSPTAKKPHFIGALTRCKIPYSAGSSPTGCNEAYLIDGQQRLTTLMLFVHALNTILNRNHSASEPDYADIQEKIDKILFCNTYPRLIPNELNRDYYNDTISKYYADKSKKVTKNSQKDTANHGLEIAFFTIYTFLNNLHSSKKDGLKFISAFLDKTTTDLEFAVIDVLTENDAPRIFETLNFRGKDLVACDIIKNRILLNLSSDPARARYVKKWISINNKLHTSNEFDLYIRYTYIAIKGKTTAKMLVHNVLEKWIKDSPTITKQFIDLLEKNIDVYLYFSDKTCALPTTISSSLNVDQKKEIDWLRDDYFRLNICKPFRVALIKASDLGANSSELLDIATIGFNFFFRKMVIMKGKLNDFISDLNDTVFKANTVTKLRTELSTLFRNKADDVSFTNKMKTFRFKSYSESKSTIGYTMIWRFESQNFGKALSSVGRSDVDIEHVFPRRYLKNWSEDIANKQIDEADLTKLGNLLLLENNLNSSVGNKYFKDRTISIPGKKDKIERGKFYYYQNGKNGKTKIQPTSFPVAKSLSAKAKNWTSNTIDKSTKKMIDGCDIDGTHYKGLKDLFPIA